MKETLIQSLCNVLLNSNENQSLKRLNKHSKQNRRQYIKLNLIIKKTLENSNFFCVLFLKLSLLFNDHMKEEILFNGFYSLSKNNL